MENKQLLTKRRILKAKKPEFIRQDAHKKRKLSWKWRKSKGSGSKMRVSRRGYKRSVQIGWGSPREVKGMNREGLKPVMVHNVNDLSKLNPKTDIAVIAATVGDKKKIMIIEQAAAKKIKISNFKEPEKFVQKIKEHFDKKKKQKEQLKEERNKKKEEVKKQALKKKEKEEAEKNAEKDLSDEEKKAQEKKEIEKALISTQ